MGCPATTTAATALAAALAAAVTRTWTATTRRRSAHSRRRTERRVVHGANRQYKPAAICCVALRFSSCIPVGYDIINGVP
eukprot:236864-Chlamydomonas_euryale.AAC.1